MSNWIVNFLRDERGAESAEFGAVVVIVAAGAVDGTDDLQDVIKLKTDETVTKIGTASV